MLVRLIFNEKGFFCLKLIFLLVRHKIIKWEKDRSEQETCLQHLSRCIYFLSSKNKKCKFFRRGVLQDESLHDMSKHSTLDSLQLSISSYGLKILSKLYFSTFVFFLKKRIFFVFLVLS